MLKSLFFIIVSFFFFVSCGEDNPVQTVEEEIVSTELIVYPFELANGNVMVFYNVYFQNKKQEDNYTEIVNLMRYENRVKITLEPNLKYNLLHKNIDNRYYYIIEIQDSVDINIKYRHNLYYIDKKILIDGNGSIIKNGIEYEQFQKKSNELNNLTKIKKIIITKI